MPTPANCVPSPAPSPTPNAGCANAPGSSPPGSARTPSPATACAPSSPCTDACTRSPPARRRPPRRSPPPDRPSTRAPTPTARAPRTSPTTPVRRPGRPDQPDDGARWGLAEFAAAEELGRSRGHWWSPDGVTLLAARVDETGLQRRYFTDPAHPELPAEDFAYPEAGGPNADVQLWVLAPDGSRTRLEWDSTAHPYVSDAGWESADEILLTVQDRLQREVVLLSADPATGRTRELSRTTHPLWVDPDVAGTPARLPDGRMLTVTDTPSGAARGLAVDGTPLTGDDVQVRAVAGLHRGALLIEAALRDPAEQQVLLLDTTTGEATALADGPGVHTVSASAGSLLLTTADADGVRRTLRTADGREFTPPTSPSRCRTGSPRSWSGSPSTRSPPPWCCPAGTPPGAGCPS